MEDARQLFKVGDKVICNGYEGAIGAVLAGQLEGMYEVRLMSGIVCVSGRDLEPLVAMTVEKKEVQVSHTPGPLEVRLTEADAAIAQKGYMPHAVVFNRGASGKNEPLTARAKADATLYAAAPDLLAAAKDMLLLYEQGQVTIEGLPASGEENPFIIELRAAIDKATPPPTRGTGHE